MKRIISLMLVCVLSLTIIPQSNAVTQRELNEENANLYNTEMITYFEQEVGYPSHYGGAWLNQNSGHLVIGLTERNEEIEQYYYDVTGADILEFETVEYSLQELHDAILGTYANVSKRSDLPQITGSAIIQRTNSVEVYVSETDAVSYISTSEITTIPQTMFEGVKANKDIVEFKTGGNIQLESSITTPGFEFTYSPGGGNAGSMGYIAHRITSSGTEIGFVTAGHSFTISGIQDYVRTIYSTTASDEEDAIGHVTFAVGPTRNQAVANPTLSVKDYGINDFAFIEVTDQCIINPTISDDTAYTQSYGVLYMVPTEGSTIYKSGFYTGRTSGQVASLYYESGDTLGTGPEIKRIAATYNSHTGDSGGIVYHRTGTSAHVIGIHQGSDKINNVTYALSVPAYYIHYHSNVKDSYFDEYSGQIRVGLPN